ncbi:sigma 54-interacting transcriptional regulator [Trabulsiella odontotermitis]|uniref:sigma 54-interacting transcriptional regulator n=1 Tax=Trabulsiella odontotermitis TaxID=379893 RepID=UPI000B0715CD|nr:sigma 54-interacting transcriptional regulator [Trabulsiella odontotermitis]
MNDVKKLSGKKIRTIPISNEEWNNHLIAMINSGVEPELLEFFHQLKDERDEYRILVDITNSVLAHLDRDGMVGAISEDIHRYFAIPSVAIAFLDGGNAGHFPVTHCLWKEDQGYYCEQKSYSLAESDIQNRIRHPQAVALTAETREPLLHDLYSAGMQVALLLPLTFNSHSPGILILAHTDISAFTPAVCSLLGQIASRISIGVDNSNAWDEITRLKDALKQENTWLNEQIQNAESLNDIIFQSTAMKNLLRQVEIVATSDSTVLLLGETGTGKELIARAIHKLSPRSAGPLVKINCAAIPASLLESDLFGHEKGAFTGATSTHIGRFEMAKGGTLFLDEIGDMPLELQPKLLRVLQEREIERVGGHQVIPVNVRVVAATNRNLKQMVEEKTFRSDLFYRLNVFPVEVPPLRDRPEDIPPLVTSFTRKLAARMNKTIDTVPAAGIQALCRYPWPGNARELQNVIERAVILTEGSTLNLQLNELKIPAAAGPIAPQLPTTTRKLPAMFNPQTPENDDDERARIVQALRETNGIVAGPRGAASKLGLKRTTLLSRMQRLGINTREL